MTKIAGFEDPHPGKPKILFVGEIHSTHALSWIEMLRDEPFNVRAVSLKAYPLPKTFTFPSYGPDQAPHRSPPRHGPTFYDRVGARYSKAKYGARWLFQRVFFGDQETSRLLVNVVRRWRPHIIHCLGLLAGGCFAVEALRRENLLEGSKLVIQLRGGSDLALNHADHDLAPNLAATLRRADAVLSDNLVNFDLMRRMGLGIEPWPGLERVPGTGGIDIDAPVFNGLEPASRRRTILWPKAYESPWSKGMPVLEALKLAWERIQPVHIHMAMAVNELPSWVALLPEAMRQHITLHDHVPRQQIFKLLREARVMLAPSLIDGTPNSMWEAMAAGAVPVVSPLATITPLVKDGENAVMARNLYPEEIANALVQTMTDDVLVDRIASTNRRLVRELAGRDTFRPKVLEFYRSLAALEHAQS